MMRLPVNRRMGIHTVYPYVLHNAVPGHVDARAAGASLARRDVIDAER